MRLYSKRALSVLALSVLLMPYQNCAPIGGSSSASKTSSSSDASGNQAGTGGGSTGTGTGTVAPGVPTVDCSARTAPILQTTSTPNQTIKVGMDNQSGSVGVGEITISGAPGSGQAPPSVQFSCNLKFYNTSGISISAGLINVTGCNEPASLVNGTYRKGVRATQRDNTQCQAGYVDVSLRLTDTTCNRSSAASLNYRINVVDGCLPEKKFVAGNAAERDYFGEQVVLAGTELAVLASYHSGAANRSGAVYLYSKSGSTWNFSTQIDPVDSAGSSALAGIQMNAIAFDGTRLALAATNRALGPVVFIFVKSSGVWSQTQQIALPAGFAASSRFGHALALNGNRLVVGAPLDGATKAGAVALYNYDAGTGTFSFDKKLTSSAPVGNGSFGWSVALEGAKLVVGSPTGGSGRVAIFDLLANTEVLIDSSLATLQLNPSGDQFGYAVAVSGGVVAVGAPTYLVGGNANGAAFVLKPSGASYTVTRYVSGTPLSMYGSALDLKGSRLVVGVPQAGTKTGLANLYNINAANPTTLVFKLMARDRAMNSWFGKSISLNSSGEVAVGSHLDDLLATETGTIAMQDAGSAFVISNLP